MAKAAFKDTAKIKVLVKANPKTEGTDSHKRFQRYFNKKCKTVKDALALGITRGDLRWDVERKFIAIA
jgi:hypothetical protein